MLEKYGKMDFFVGKVEQKLKKMGIDPRGMVDEEKPEGVQ